MVVAWRCEGGQRACGAAVEVGGWVAVGVGEGLDVRVEMGVWWWTREKPWVVVGC